MNNTAHCFLSYADPDLLVGNFIGDFVKGNKWLDYPVGIQRGIILHRIIDSYTDNHSATRLSVGRVRDFAGRYAPPVVDILYDHLLCLNWEHCTDIPFDTFASWAYLELESRLAEMPPVLQKRVPQMVAGRFLHGYQTREGLEWVLNQFNRRLSERLDVRSLLTFFFNKLEAFSEDFQTFFPDLQQEVLRFRTEQDQER
ncbi:MAG: DUF479 domain-containing protein [Bacteroidetes bacterium]|nr:MAG: DUF479 domain-containing protein [Bacteroidota bacterium]